MQPMVLPFAVGLFVGILAGVLASRLVKRLNRSLATLPGWTLGHVCAQSGGQVEIEADVPASTTLVKFVRFHTKVLTADPITIGDPSSLGATQQSNTSPMFSPGTGVASTSNDCVIVWAEFTVFDPQPKVGLIPACTGSGSDGTSSGGMLPAPMRSPAATEQLTAIPRAYRVALEKPLVGPVAGPASELVGGALPPGQEGQLEYSSDTSTPSEPVWQARSGAESIIGWTLRLLYQQGGLGAVLSVGVGGGGQERRVTWVTSNWHSHKTNRLTCEADEPGIPAVLVRPA